MGRQARLLGKPRAALEIARQVIAAIPAPAAEN
jgi:hypothetical protein